MNREELERKFEVLYKNKIIPRVQTLEEDKLNITNNNKILKIILLILFLMLITFCVLLNIFSNISSPDKLLIQKVIIVFLFVFICISFYVFIISGINNNKKTDAILTEIKERIQPLMLSLFGNFNITNDEIITLEEIQKIGLYNYFATKKEDYNTLFGTSTDNVEVSISVTELFHKNEIDYQQILDFEGLILKANIKRKNKCNIIVTKNNCEIGLPEDFVLLDNVESKYMIYSNNKNEAERIITSDFIKIITEIEKIFCPTSLNFILKDEYFYLFLNSVICNNEEECTNDDNSLAFYPKFFEIGDIETNLLEKELYKKAFSELYSLFSLIDYFKLDQRTGL